MKIDGRKIAKNIGDDLEKQVEGLAIQAVQPHLVIILIGSDAASKAYIRQKIKKGTEIGINITLKRFPKNTSEKTVIKFVQLLNADSSVHGIIIQRPVAARFSSQTLSTAVITEKDVDGFHPASNFQPPLALAVMQILQEIYTKQSHSSSGPIHASSPFHPFKNWLSSQNIVFIGRGEAGGQPVIKHIEKLGITHSIIHSLTQNPEKLLKEADIIISAVGKASLVKPEQIKKGVILIGIGLHSGKDHKLHGDYDEEEIKDIASYYTPTPGGVGPLNVTMLLKNVVESALKKS